MNVYCKMSSVSGCSGGGWTMVMKIDGSRVRITEENSFDHSVLNYFQIQTYSSGYLFRFRKRVKDNFNVFSVEYFGIQFWLRQS